MEYNITATQHDAVRAFHAAAVELLCNSDEAQAAEKALIAAGLTGVDEIIATVMEQVIEDGPEPYQGFRDDQGTWYAAPEQAS